MSDRLKATLIHNPTAGDGQHDSDDLIEILADAGFQVRYQSTKKDWKKALKADADMVIAAGGDGTLAKVMREMRGMDTPVALLPLGTANNIGRSFRILGGVPEIVRAWRGAEPIAVDLGRASWDGEDRSFVEGCGGGLFAAAIDKGSDKIEDGSFFLGNEVDRALIFLLDHIRETEPVRWQVAIDGADYSGEYSSVEILNIRFAGPSVPLAPDADMTDGTLNVALIGAEERAALMEYLKTRIDDAAAAPPGLKIVRGREIAVSPSGAPFRIDDEIVNDGSGDHDGLEFKIGVEPGAVRVLAPDVD